MIKLTEEICQEQLELVRRRLEALDKIEAKLQEMRSLASYAASRNLGECEAAQVQEWVDILQAEINAMVHLGDGSFDAKVVNWYN